MIHGEKNFTFTITPELRQQRTVTITIPNQYVTSLYNEAIQAQKAEAHTYGFSKGTTPLHYIEHNFKPNIIEHLKELLFTHCIMNFLCASLAKHKIVVAGEPALLTIALDPQGETYFKFGLTCVATEAEDRWKRLNFRAPERKNYKDLDRQVESFMKDELERAETTSTIIQTGDWVCFTMTLVDSKHAPLLKNYSDELWVKMNDEEADRELHSLFIGKKVGEKFFTNSSFLQDYISNELDMHYLFLITIKDSVPHAYFSFDSFKRHFQLKTPKETHHKLIEVFSYRNDLSQRRETIEATFKLLLKQYFIPLAPHLLEHQRKTVLNKVHANPDYHVYKAQTDFKEKIKLLAEKQLKEAIIIDTIAYQDNVHVDHEDIVGYLNLIKRPRTKEFVYFDLPATKLNGQEVPLATEVLKQYCLREKTLNHVIYHLTKKT